MGLIGKPTKNKFFKRTALTASALFLLTGCAILPTKVQKLEPKTYQKCTLEEKLRTGVAKIKITPKIDEENKVPIAGYGAHFTDKLAEGVHDDVYTRALILDNGYKKIGVVNADIVIITRDLKIAVEKKVKEADLDELLIVATHNHSGPGGYVDNLFAEIVCTGHYQPKLFDNLVDKMSKAILEADKNLELSKIGTGSGYIDNISKSRREVKTPIDPEVGVIKVDDIEGNPKAYIVNFAAHPTTFKKDNRLISADFPGYMAKYLEENEGVVAIFTNGAMGDIRSTSPLPYKDLFEKAQNIGKALADKVLEISKEIETTENVRLNSIVTVFDLPKVKLYKNYNLAKIFVGNYLPKDTSLQVVEINDTMLVGTPCDLGVEVGLEIKKKSGYEHTFAISQANDYMGYVIPEKRYEEGGYEAKMHFHGPKVAELFIRKTLELIKYLKE